MPKKLAHDLAAAYGAAASQKLIDLTIEAVRANETEALVLFENARQELENVKSQRRAAAMIGAQSG